MAKQDANWVEIAPETLSEATAERYNGYKAAYRHAKAERERFEAAMTADANLPQGKRLVFGYNFGKLSVAVVDDDRKPKATRGTVSLADYLAAQAVQGR